MPSRSAAQHRIMEAAAHTPGGYGGVPQSVGREFVAADKRKGRKRTVREDIQDAIAKHNRDPKAHANMR